MYINNVVSLRNTAHTIQPQLALTEGPKSFHLQPTQAACSKQRREAVTATTGVFPLIKQIYLKHTSRSAAILGTLGFSPNP